ncbi:MAG: prohibitin family protein [Devosia sp.]
MSITQSTPPPRRRRRWLDGIIIAFLAVGIALIFFWQTLFVVVPPGSAGVLYRVFSGGTDLNVVLREGIVYKWPWNSVYLYETRTQESDVHVIAQSTDGLIIELDISILYHPNEDELPQLHVALGPDYYERKIRPIVMQATRQVIGETDPHELYSQETTSISLKILDLARDEIVPNNIELVDVIIRRLLLPPTVNDAIARKLVEEQAVQTHKFRLELEQIEAERKRIEAIGIQQFYAVVGEALTPALLTWRGIEATIQVARSNNSKVVIVGGGQDQMPLILGSDISKLPEKPAPTTSSTDGDIPGPADFDSLPPLFPDPRDPNVISPSDPSTGTTSMAPTTSDTPSADTATTTTPAEPAAASAADQPTSTRQQSQ